MATPRGATNEVERQTAVHASCSDSAGSKRQRIPESEDLTPGTSEPAIRERISRTVQDYIGAIYPCTIFEGDGEYAALSPAYPTGLGSSSTSAAEAVEDLRERIETDIREIIEDGRDWWARKGDRKLVPFPGELPSKSSASFEHYLRQSGFGLHRMYEATLTVFPEGV